MGPWIHVGSTLQHLTPGHVGDEISVRAQVAKNYENKGHKIVELDALVIAGKNADRSRHARRDLRAETGAGGIATQDGAPAPSLRGTAVRKNGVASLAYGDEAIQLRATRANQKRGARCELRAFLCARFARAGLLRFARNDA